MFLRQFQYLVTLAEERHFSRAAARCNVTQPSLSSAIKQLELELGVALVMRDQRFQGFTAEGQRVIQWAKRMLADQEAMFQELAAMRNNLEGHLRLAAVPASLPVLQRIAQQLRDRHPGLRLSVQFTPDADIVKHLETHDINAAITYGGGTIPSSATRSPLYIESLCLLVGDSHTEVGPGPVTWAQASRLPLGLPSRGTPERQKIDLAFAESGCRAEPVIEMESVESLMLHALTGGCVTVVPDQFERLIGERDRIRLLPLVEPAVKRQLDLVWLTSQPIMPAVSALRQAADDLRLSGAFECGPEPLSQAAAG